MRADIHASGLVLALAAIAFIGTDISWHDDLLMRFGRVAQLVKLEVIYSLPLEKPNIILLITILIAILKLNFQ